MTGYRDPPKETRFKPGQSGNPAGRRPRFESFEIDLFEALNAEISVREKGVERKISNQQAVIRSLVTAAIDGNLRAAVALLSLIPRPAPPPAEPSQELLADGDPELLKSLDRRQRRLRDNARKDSTGTEQT